ncbi:MAG: MarR family winged helix-turn-helix transcriptional regulator [Filifactoraceae bacterium]
MEDLNEKLNNMLVEAYTTILKAEEEMIKSVDKIDLSMSEMHMIESVGKFNSGTISDIAGDLGITLPSVTISINKLIKKGYIEKIKSEIDARMVHVKLTHDGERVNSMHRYFHRKMTDAVIHEMSDDEKDAVYRGVKKLKNFFEKKITYLNDKKSKEE